MLTNGRVAALVHGRAEATESDLFSTNNFDLIRLFAALQVAISHGFAHLGVNAPAGLGWLPYFPGVPVFFFVSGFLISRSYESAGSLSDYSVNRTLRIYPALVVCTLVSVLILLATGYLSVNSVGIGPTVAWVLAQITIFQFYNPDFLRGFGVGVVNGSLWTIAVELQCYVLVPVVYRLIGRVAPSKRGFDAILAFLCINAACINAAYFAIDPAQWNTMGRKFLGVSFIPWFYMFLLGVMAQRWFVQLRGLVAPPRAPLILAAYVLLCSLTVDAGLVRSGNGISPPLFLLLAALVLSCAYSMPKLAGTLLGRNDLSYGIYIYHMPIINLFIFQGLVGMTWHLAAVLGIVFCAAFLSWRFVERPALSRKSHPFYPVIEAANGGSKGGDR